MRHCVEQALWQQACEFEQLFEVFSKKCCSLISVRTARRCAHLQAGLLHPETGITALLTNNREADLLRMCRLFRDKPSQGVLMQPVQDALVASAQKECALLLDTASKAIGNLSQNSTSWDASRSDDGQADVAILHMLEQLEVRHRACLQWLRAQSHLVAVSVQCGTESAQ